MKEGVDSILSNKVTIRRRLHEPQQNGPEVFLLTDIGVLMALILAVSFR